MTASDVYPSPSAPWPGDTPVLKVSKVSKTYPGNGIPALSELSLTVARGEILGLLGPNGAGKTTAIAILSTLIRPTGGQVTVCGVNLQEHPRQVRRLIGVVPQSPALYDRLSAAENLAYFGKLQGLRGPVLKQAVATGLELAGLTQRAHERVKALSGGMQRRLNLAIGMLHQPRLLLLDEPTVGVDAQSRNLIFENLKRLQQQGMAMLYTTHNMEEAELLCSRIAIMDLGQVISAGTCQELLQSEPSCRTLSDLFLKRTGKQLRD